MSNETKHTPGPHHAYDTDAGWIIRGGPHNHRTAEGMRKGDAILYSAAPDLLEALKALQLWSWSLPLTYREAEVWHDVDKAIAKAVQACT